MKKHSQETQTLHTGCSKAEPIFLPRRRPPSRGRAMAKIQSAGDGHYLHLQTQFDEDRCMQFRVIVLTDPQTNPQTQTHRTDYDTLHRSLACSVTRKQLLTNIKSLKAILII